MPFLLRMVKKSRWYDLPEWLDADAARGDALRDLLTDEDTLSFWEVDSAYENLNRIVAALAAKRDDFQAFDYLLLEDERVRQLGIEIVPTPGDCADTEAGMSWHRDLVKLSATRVAALAALARQSGQVKRMPWKDVRTAVVAGLAERHLDLGEFNTKLAAKCT